MPANNVKSRHSPGPWTLKTLGAMGPPQAIVKKLPHGKEQFICLFVRSGGISNEEALANAVLIEKAPDLLRCLSDLSNAFYRSADDPEGLLRINRSCLDCLAALLNELGGESL